MYVRKCMFVYVNVCVPEKMRDVRLLKRHLRTTEATFRRRRMWASLQDVQVLSPFLNAIPIPAAYLCISVDIRDG